MLRLLARLFLLFAIAVLAISVAVWAATFSPSYEKCQTESANKSGRQEQSQFRYRVGTITDCEAVFANENGNAITGIATILLGLITGLLVWIAYDQSRTSRAQLRAYVSALPQGMVLDKDGRTVIAIVQVKNVGQTPAFRAQTRSAIIVEKLPPPKAFHLNPVDEGKVVPTFVMFPGGEHVNAPRKFLDGDELMKMDDGKHGLYMFGRVTYRDIFRAEQWTEFCAVLEKRDFKEWLATASTKRGEEIAARFKFTEGNNTASQNRR